MSEQPKPNIPPAAAEVPPAAPAKEEAKKESILDIIEQDFIAKLNGKVALEEFADLTQEARIKTFRALEKALTKAADNPAPPKEKSMGQKNQSVDPVAAKPMPSSKYKTLVEQNNPQVFQDHALANSPILSLAKQLRGQ